MGRLLHQQYQQVRDESQYLMQRGLERETGSIPSTVLPLVSSGFQIYTHSPTSRPPTSRILTRSRGMARSFTSNACNLKVKPFFFIKITQSYNVETLRPYYVSHPSRRQTRYFLITRETPCYVGGSVTCESVRIISVDQDYRKSAFQRYKTPAAEKLKEWYTKFVSGWVRFVSLLHFSSS